MLELSTLGALLVLLGAIVLWKQLAAKHCPRHQRVAGAIAIIITILCWGIGLPAIGFVLWALWTS